MSRPYDEVILAWLFGVEHVSHGHSGVEKLRFEKPKKPRFGGEDAAGFVFISLFDLKQTTTVRHVAKQLNETRGSAVTAARHVLNSYLKGTALKMWQKAVVHKLLCTWF